MVDALTDLDRVYAKWEGKNPHIANGNPEYIKSPQIEYGATEEKKSWNTKFSNGNQPPPPMRKGPGTGRTWGERNSDLMKIDPRLRIANSSMTSSFKSMPVIRPNLGEIRPFPGRCCDCMPESKNFMTLSDSIRHAGLRDLLKLPTQDRENPWMTRTFYHVSSTLQRNLKISYSDVTSAVLASPRLSESIEKTVSEECGAELNDKKVNTTRKKEESRAKAILTRMKAGISNKMTRFTYWVLHKLFNRLLSHVLVHNGQIEVLQQVCKKRVPVIFLPTHRSHLDYIILTFVMVSFNIKSPHVAAGDNLLIPFFGSLMRCLGGFFIRRKLDKVAGKKDHIYRAVLHTYMEELLRNNEYMEFFIEGGRTRTGKSIHPKGGLLSVLVESLNTGVIPDCYLVPVSISYDKLVDGNFNKEQMGERKSNETFWNAIVAIYRVIIGRYGSVRADFGQPFSLREYLSVSKLYPRLEERRRTSSGSGDMSNDSDSKSTTGDQSLITVTPDRLGTTSLTTMKSRDSGMSIDFTTSAEHRHVVQCLAEHIVYEHCEMQAITSVQILACLMLTNHRQGVSLENLISSFNILRKDVIHRDHDLAFSGETQNVIYHAQNLLGDKLIKRRIEEKEKNRVGGSGVWFEPVITIPTVFELSYYANVVGTLFAVESVLVNTIYGMFDRETWTNRAHNVCSVHISKKRLLVEAAELCRIFRYEYLFVPPCLTLDQVVSNGFDRLRNSALLVSAEDETDKNNYLDRSDRDWAQRFVKHLDNQDDSDNDEGWVDDDEIYELNNEEDLVKKFTFLKSILSSIIETYYVTACHLTHLLDDDMPESDFVSLVHNALKERATTEAACYAESASIETLKSSIRGFEYVKVISCYQTNNVAMIGLSDEYVEQSVLNRFICRLQSLRE